MNKDMEIQNQIFLVDCSDLKTLISRNMQPMVFKKIQPLNIEVIYGGMLVKYIFFYIFYSYSMN